MADYLVGNKVTITGTFTNLGTPTDPAVVHAHYIPPGGVQVDLVYGVDVELVKVSVGVYAFDLLLDLYGKWNYRMDDDNNNVATEGYITAIHSRFSEA